MRFSRWFKKQKQESKQGHESNQSESKKRREYYKAEKREFDKRMDIVAREMTYKNEDEQVAWLTEYTREEQHGIAILQRQRRLQEDQKAPQSTSESDKLPVELPIHDKPPGYEEPPSALDQELKQLRIEYKKHLYRLDNLHETTVYGAVSWQFI